MTETITVDQTDKLDPEEILYSLNGYEEVGIEKAFGFRLESLEDNALRGIRALYFIVKKREGLTHDQAKHSAMELTLGQLMEVFDMDDIDVPADPEATLGEAPAPEKKRR